MAYSHSPFLFASSFKNILKDKRSCVNAVVKQSQQALAPAHRTHDYSRKAADYFHLGQSAAFGLVVFSLINEVLLGDVPDAIRRWDRENDIPFPAIITERLFALEREPDFREYFSSFFPIMAWSLAGMAIRKRYE
jgi:hypothetical protein